MGRILPAIGVLILLTSCVPYRYTVTPHLAGCVVDASTTRPIDGAKVSVTSSQGGIYHRSRTVRTDDAGEFDVPALKAWGVYVLPQEFAGPCATLQIEASGYHPYVEEHLGSWRSPRGGEVKPVSFVESGRITDLQMLRIPLEKL